LRTGCSALGLECASNLASGPMALPSYFMSPADFREWLARNYSCCPELLVGFYKKSSGKGGITHPQALDDALCFGWIDGVRKSINCDAYTIRFTPGKAKSQWSAVNIKRAQELSAAGRMHSAGLKAFDAAKAQKRKYSYEQRQESHFSADHERQFHAKPGAWEFFKSQPAGYRRTSTFWVVSAKQGETRQRRLDLGFGKWPED
jgi:uncharacterized protein YdeI (YjbR/CyaY-like superfamily)